jgi:hypothetical protein
MRRQNEQFCIFFIFVMQSISGSFLQAEPIRRAPAKHAAVTRDGYGVKHADRDRNHPLILESLHALRRKHSRDIAVP